MSDLRELYQEVIIDHSRHPRNFHAITDATHHADGFNRLCGDKLTLYLKVENNLITDISFQGSGCAISTASASLMSEQLKGKTLEQARQLFETFHQLMTAAIPMMGNADIGKLKVLSGVREFPARVKCATLAWHTLQAALAGKQAQVTTE